jgi:hypothetical protein
MRSLGMYFIVHSVPIQPTSNYYSILILFFISKEVWVLGGYLFTPESYWWDWLVYISRIFAASIFPDYVTLVFGDLLSLLRGFPLSLVPFQLIKPPNVQETHLRSKKILVSKQHCCRMHNYMRATDSCHIALVYTYKQPRLNKPITNSVLCEA